MFAPNHVAKLLIVPTLVIFSLVALAQWLTRHGEIISGKRSAAHAHANSKKSKSKDHNIVDLPPNTLDCQMTKEISQSFPLKNYPESLQDHWVATERVTGPDSPTMRRFVSLNFWLDTQKIRSQWVCQIKKTLQLEPIDAPLANPIHQNLIELEPEQNFHYAKRHWLKPPPVPKTPIAVSFETVAFWKNDTLAAISVDVPPDHPPRPPVSKAFQLFATPNSPGSIAIGAAEGTRTPQGEITKIYWGHADPANGLRNLGTFSYQHEANSPQEADTRQLQRLQEQIAQIQSQAEAFGISLSNLELVAGADLANQAPAAALDYVQNLQQARTEGLRGIDAILKARMQSFVNPETNTLEAAGFGNSWTTLKEDQRRRLKKIKKTLDVQGIK